MEFAAISPTDFLFSSIRFLIMLYIRRSEFEEGIRKAYRNAVDFIECAEILRDQKKLNAAVALAIHAREELGKAIKLLDEIDRGSPRITEEKWEKKYTDHKSKLVAANIAVQKYTGYKRFEWDGRKWKTKGEGDAAKEFADFDLEHRERSYYVDYDFRGGKGWQTPLERDTLTTPDDFIKIARIVKTIVEKKCECREITL